MPRAYQNKAFPLELTERLCKNYGRLLNESDLREIVRAFDACVAWGALNAEHILGTAEETSWRSDVIDFLEERKNTFK